MSAPPATAGPAQPDPASAQLTKKPDQKKTPVFTTKVNSGNTTHHSKIGDPALPMRGKQPPHSKKPAPELQPAPPIKGVAAAVSEGYSAKPPPPPARKGDGAKKRANAPKPPPPVARMLAPTVKPEPVRPRAAGDLSDDEFGAEIEAENPDLLAKLRKIDAERLEKDWFSVNMIAIPSTLWTDQKAGGKAPDLGQFSDQRALTDHLARLSAYSQRVKTITH